MNQSLCLLSRSKTILILGLKDLSPFIQEASFNKWYLEPLVFRTCEDVWLVIEGASSVLIWMSTHTSSRPNSRSSLLWHTSSKKSVFNFGTCPFVTISFFFWHFGLHFYRRNCRKAREMGWKRGMTCNKGLYVAICVVCILTAGYQGAPELINFKN